MQEQRLFLWEQGRIFTEMWTVYLGALGVNQRMVWNNSLPTWIFEPLENEKHRICFYASSQALCFPFHTLALSQAEIPLVE